MQPTPEWIDVHCHLNMLETSVEETLTLAKNAGVTRVVTIGTQPEDWPLVLDFSQRYFPVVSGTLGVHPHDASKYSKEAGDFLRQEARRPEIIAIGEIGLDYFYENSDRPTQLAAFETQLGIAEELNLPVEIHTRDAEDETIQILKNFEGRVRGLLHCFTGTQKLADAALNLGWNISISGVVTFKNAEDLRRTVATIPLDRLHVETDAPFLAPVPHRGKKNTPAYVSATALKVAEIKGISLDLLSQETKKNALSLFPKINWK